jgi:hypothetical protein
MFFSCREVGKSFYYYGYAQINIKQNTFFPLQDEDMNRVARLIMKNTEKELFLFSFLFNAYE